MPTHKTDNPHEPRLPGEETLQRAFRAAAHDEPPAALDRAILDQARRAAGQPDTHRSRTARWVLPLSAAAVVVLSVSVGLQLSQRSEPELEQVASPETTAESPPPTSNIVAMQKRAAPAESAADATLAERFEDKPMAPAAAPNKTSPTRTESVGRTLASKEEQRVTALASGAAKPAAIDAGHNADVIAVDVSGGAGAYQLSVTIRSPDAGCKQYADWWEIVSLDGNLLYRRVLLHSHTDEQPFTRSGGPVPLQADTIVWVRAHMNNTGYGGDVFKGSAQSGFARAPLPRDFAAHLQTQPPLPTDCGF